MLSTGPALSMRGETWASIHTFFAVTVAGAHHDPQVTAISRGGVIWTLNRWVTPVHLEQPKRLESWELCPGPHGRQNNGPQSCPHPNPRNP